MISDLLFLPKGVVILEIKLFQDDLKLLNRVVEIRFGAQPLRQNGQEVVYPGCISFSSNGANPYGFLIDHFHDLPLLSVL